MKQDNQIIDGKSIYDVLNKITQESKNNQKERGLDFRFLDKNDSQTEKDKEIGFERIEELEQKLNSYGISVEFYEDIDIKDVSEGHKFYFRIYDMNNCFVEIDALEYRKIVMDASKSEVDYIANKLFEIIGLKVQANVLDISNLIVEIISYTYYYSELQYKIYENIGWDLYDKELIFKYDRIYKDCEEEIRSACTSDIAGKLTNDYSEKIEFNWRDKFAKLMNSSTIARIVISAACTGLVRSIIPYNKENNINMNIVGEPGSGKSSLSQFALSIFGNPQALEGSFIDKEGAMEVIRVKRPVIPYILDDRLLKMDTLSDKAKSKELMYDIFREYEGKVTERLGGSYKGLSGKRTNAPIISSSVDSMIKVLLESGKDLGQYRRFIELELKREEIFEGQSSVAAEYHNLAYQNYGIGVQYIVNYILNVGIQFVNDLYNRILIDITSRLEKKSEDTNISGLSSSASRFALIATTYVIIREAINDVSIEYLGKSINKIEFIGGKDILSEKNWIEYNSDEHSYGLLDDSSMMERLLQKDDKYYTDLIEYLINNLINKMQVVNFRIDVAENIRSFLTDKSNDKWFYCKPKSKTKFFSELTTTYIGYKQRTDKKITIMFKDDINVEWLFCSGIKFSDEQISDFLKCAQTGDNKEIAEKFFGSHIICKNIEEEIKRYPDYLKFNHENRAGNERHIASITITLPELEEKEEKCDETE